MDAIKHTMPLNAPIIIQIKANLWNGDATCNLDGGSNSKTYPFKSANDLSKCMYCSPFEDVWRPAGGLCHTSYETFDFHLGVQKETSS